MNFFFLIMITHKPALHCSSEDAIQKWCVYKWLKFVQSVSVYRARFIDKKIDKKQVLANYKLLYTAQIHRTTAIESTKICALLPKNCTCTKYNVGQLVHVE